MRIATILAVLLWLTSSLSGSAAEPPVAAKPAPTPATTPAGSAGSTPPKAPAPSPATPSDAATEPEHIEPTEKVHSDTEVSFPVDI
jgi:hypothetical protein